MDAGRAALGALVGMALGFFARDLGLVGIASAWVPMTVVGLLVSPSRRLLRLLAAALAAAALVWLAAAFTALTARVAGPLVRAEPPRPADAVVVLASRLQTSGEPTTTALGRLLRGLELVHAGHAPRLLLTELAPPAPSYEAAARRQMERLGLTAELRSVGPVASTREEALSVGTLCRENGWKTVLVVTSPTHSRRACAAFAREIPDVVCVPARETEADLVTLDRPAERLAALRLAVHEWAGLALYRWRGWLAPAPQPPE